MGNHISVQQGAHLFYIRCPFLPLSQRKWIISNLAVHFCVFSEWHIIWSSLSHIKCPAQWQQRRQRREVSECRPVCFSARATVFTFKATEHVKMVSLRKTCLTGFRVSVPVLWPLLLHLPPFPVSPTSQEAACIFFWQAEVLLWEWLVVWGHFLLNLL